MAGSSSREGTSTLRTTSLLGYGLKLPGTGQWIGDLDGANDGQSRLDDLGDGVGTVASAV